MSESVKAPVVVLMKWNETTAGADGLTLSVTVLDYRNKCSSSTWLGMSRQSRLNLHHGLYQAGMWHQCRWAPSKDLARKHCLLVVLHHITTVSVAHGVLCLATANNNALALHTLTGGSVASPFIFWQRQKLTPLPIMMRIMLVPEVGLEPTATRLKA